MSSEAGRVELTRTVALTPREIAEAFCDLSDDGQAQVLIECAAIAGTWAGQNLDQWFAVGRHLRDCECADSEARYLVQRIYEGTEP